MTTEITTVKDHLAAVRADLNRSAVLSKDFILSIMEDMWHAAILARDESSDIVNLATERADKAEKDRDQAEYGQMAERLTAEELSKTVDAVAHELGLVDKDANMLVYAIRDLNEIVARELSNSRHSAQMRDKAEQALQAANERAEKAEKLLSALQGPECMDSDCADYDGEHPYHQNIRVRSLDEAQTEIRKERARADRAERALEKINEIRVSIVGAQTVNWSEHIYPLAAALDEVGMKSPGYDIARERVSTLIERAEKAESERDELRRSVGDAKAALQATNEREWRMLEEYAILATWREATRAAHAHFAGCQVCQDAVMVGPCYAPFREAMDAAEKAALATEPTKVEPVCTAREKFNGGNGGKFHDGPCPKCHQSEYSSMDKQLVPADGCDICERAPGTVHADHCVCRFDCPKCGLFRMCECSKSTVSTPS